MASAPLILSDSIDAIAELAAFAERLGFSLRADVEDPINTLEGVALLAFVEPPSRALLLRSSERSPSPLIFYPSADRALEMLAEELGLALYTDPEAAVAALRLREYGAAISGRGLSAYQRRRLGISLPREGAKLVAIDAATLAVDLEETEIENKKTPLPLGSIRATSDALHKLSSVDDRSALKMPHVEGADRQTVEEILLGPPRVLSDPASKAVLFAYGIALPDEELCASPSRAAAEAQRIGFPVRLALASPELRPSAHPDLIVDGVDSASRAREVFRQLQTLASLRDSGAKLLGVTVSASSIARALLSVELRLFGLDREAPDEEAIGADRVEVSVELIGLHSSRPIEATLIVLPTHPSALLRAMERLPGAEIILGESPAERRHRLNELAELLYRLASLLRDFPDELIRVSVPRLAVLESGELEIREALVEIGDAFSRRLA